MTSPRRFSRSCLPLITISAFGALAALALPGPQAALPPVTWTTMVAEATVERDLRQGCQQVVALIASGSPDAAWSVGRLRTAVASPALGSVVQAMAHRGLALAYRTGSGIAPDPTAAAEHEAHAAALDPQGSDRHVARR